MPRPIHICKKKNSLDCPFKPPAKNCNNKKYYDRVVDFLKGGNKKYTNLRTISDNDLKQEYSSKIDELLVI